MRKHGWRTPQWKLIVSLEPDFHFKPEIELYDLIRDPEENHNVADENPEVVAMLKTRMEKFIAKHPDFCYQGSRATLAVSGHEGVFGYRINPEVIDKKGQAYYDEQVAGAKKIVTALRQKGYEIACYTYADTAYGGKSATDIRDDISKWTTHIVPVIGQVDTLVYAKTSDISANGDYTTSKFNVLYGAGFRYFIAHTTGDPSCKIAGNYVRQLRIMVTGTQMAHASNTYAKYFDSQSVLNSSRGNVPQ
jgi:hypothetical protein